MVYRLKCAYVNDPTLTWDENNQEIRNEFQNSGGDFRTTENTTQFSNLPSNLLAITNNEVTDSTIYHEEGIIQMEREPINN